MSLTSISAGATLALTELRREATYMASEIVFLVEESPEGGYEGRALGFSIYTEADTIEEMKQAAADAVRCHFDEAEMPRIIRLHN